AVGVVGRQEAVRDEVVLRVGVLLGRRGRGGQHGGGDGERRYREQSSLHVSRPHSPSSRRVLKAGSTRRGRDRIGGGNIKSCSVRSSPRSSRPSIATDRSTSRRSRASRSTSSTTAPTGSSSRERRARPRRSRTTSGSSSSAS